MDAQKDLLQKEAKHKGFQNVKTFSDEGGSGKNTTGRPEFQEMMRRIENDNEDDVHYVLVFILSRFGRNTADVLFNLQLMQDYGVNLFAVEEGIGSSGNVRKLMISVISAVAEIERESIREQTMEGRREKARQGKRNGGQAPFGYQLEAGKFVIDEEEAKKAVLERVDLYPERQENGRYVKTVKFLSPFCSRTRPYRLVVHRRPCGDGSIAIQKLIGIGRRKMGI